MTREEMLRRLEDKEDPLAISIVKWEEIWLGLGRVGGAENCALCYRFQTHLSDIVVARCKYCPVYRKTGKTLCDGTPYHKLISHRYKCDECYDDYTCKKGRKKAYKMLKFLKKLAKW